MAFLLVTAFVLFAPLMVSTWALVSWMKANPCSA